MNEKQSILKLIKQGESSGVEFLTTANQLIIAKIICGFLNTNGGVLIIGVSGDGDIKGINNADMLKSKLKSYLLQFIIPEAPISMSIELIYSKEVIVVWVYNGSKPPYVFEGTIYTRKNNRTHKATPNDISNLIMERQTLEMHWERKPVIDFGVEDLDEVQIQKTLEDVNKYGRGKIFSYKKVEDFLSYYGLYRNGYFTNAAVILFAKEPVKYIPQCRVRLIVFKDTKSSNEYGHDLMFENNLFNNVNNIFQFFNINISAGSSFSEKTLYRQNLKYPIFALREGIMNALVHRDYSDSAGSVTIAFYPNRLEMVNTGELPGNLKVSDLSKAHISVPRNPDIAHICYLRRMIEKIGRGTIKIIEDCKDKNYPRPSWKSSSGVTTLTLPGITILAKDRDSFSNAIVDLISNSISVSVSDNVKERLISIIYYIYAHKGTKISDLLTEFNISRRTLFVDLNVLTNANIIEYLGSKKSGHYSVKKRFANKF